MEKRIELYIDLKTQEHDPERAEMLEQIRVIEEKLEEATKRMADLLLNQEKIILR